MNLSSNLLELGFNPILKSPSSEKCTSKRIRKRGLGSGWQCWRLLEEVSNDDGYGYINHNLVGIDSFIFTENHNTYIDDCDNNILEYDYKNPTKFTFFTPKSIFKCSTHHSENGLNDDDLLEFFADFLICFRKIR